MIMFQRYESIEWFTNDKTETQCQLIAMSGSLGNDTIMGTYVEQYELADQTGQEILESVLVALGKWDIIVWFGFLSHVCDHYYCWWVFPLVRSVSIVGEDKDYMC